MAGLTFGSFGSRIARAAWLAGVVCTAAMGCGGVDQSTACSFDPACIGGVPDGSTGDTSSGGDTSPVDSEVGVCKPGDTKMLDCNTCTCSSRGDWVCTKKGCPDTGPPPSTCPKDRPPKDSACTGTTHCIYTLPCPFGCDCVDGKWQCVDPICPDGG